MRLRRWEQRPWACRGGVTGPLSGISSSQAADWRSG